jgi:hypothetical protein
VNGAAYIPLPTVAKLASLPGYAASANYSFTIPGGNAAVASTRARLEFVAMDLNNDGNATDDNEGFFRVFIDTASKYLDGSGGGSAPSDQNRADWDNGKIVPYQCGDWHLIKDATGPGFHNEFFPYVVHNTAWFASYLVTNGQGVNAAAANAEKTATTATVFSHAGARCYPAGSPYLVAVERPQVGPTANYQKGGTDTTFTAATRTGYWVPWPGAPVGGVVADLAAGNQQPIAQWLFPLWKGYNANTKGVIYVNGSIAISGVLRGKVTLYASGNIVHIDDLVYATDPSAGTCNDMLGTIAGLDDMIADNLINSPSNISGAWKMMSANSDFYFHGVSMSLTNTVAVENFSNGAYPTTVTHCNGANTSRGCIFQTGGVIQKNLSATTDFAGHGFWENRDVDECMYTRSPPYFPLTGRYFDNRYYEIDPVRFNVVSLFNTLQGGY